MPKRLREEPSRASDRILNEEVFKHSGLTWEWGMVAGFTIVFQALAELYKFVKRKTMKPISSKATISRDAE